MPRLARVDVANNVYHVINRATGRLQIFNTPEGDEVLCTIRNLVNKEAPYGRESWVDAIVKEHKLEITLRGGGRPRVSN